MYNRVERSPSKQQINNLVETMLWRTKSHHSQASEQDLARTASASKNDPSASASQAAGTAWLAGHLNHLTPEQEEKLVEFKAVCAERKYYTPAVEAAEGVEAVPASHDDATMLYVDPGGFDCANYAAHGMRLTFSFLLYSGASCEPGDSMSRGRGVNSRIRRIGARRMPSRRSMRISALTRTRLPGGWYVLQLRELYTSGMTLTNALPASIQYPQWTGRRDRRGIPVYVFEIRHLNSKEMANYNNTMTTGTPETHKSSTVPARLLNLFALYENLLNFVMPLCSALSRPNPETPIVTSTNIVDVSGVGLKQFWNLKGHMQDASVLATAHYPETLDRIFVC